MSRFKVLKANPRRTLAALATVLVAVGITGASGANFTAQSANPANTFTAGSMHILNSKEGSAVFTTSPNMKPGDTSTGEVEIKNDGTLAGTFKLLRGTLSDALASPKLSDQLNMVVTDCGPDKVCSTTGDNLAPLYTGTLAAMGSTTLGTPWAVNETHRYEFKATLDNLTPNTYQGLSSTVQFDWTATS
jgi:hypothetical protein